MENALFTLLLGISISFSSISPDINLKGDKLIQAQETTERAIHPCDGAWILYYRHARYECGYSTSQSQAYANQQVALCHQNMQ